MMSIKAQKRILCCLGILSGLFFHSLTKAQSSSSTQAEVIYQESDAAYKSFLKNYQEQNYQRSLSLFGQAIQAYEEQNIVSPELADSYSKRGILFHINADYDQALSEYLKAVEIKKQLPNQADSVYFLELILVGNIHYYQDRYDSALYYYSEAEDIAIQYPDLYERKRLFNSLGAYYADQGDHYQGIANHQKALSSLEKRDPDYQRDYYLVKNNIAVSQLQLEKYQEAIRSLQQIQGKAKAHSSLFYENMGSAYYAVANYDSAIFFLAKALDKATSADSVSILNKMGKIYHTIDRKEDARRYFRRSLAMNLAVQNRKNTDVTTSYLGLGDLILHEYPDTALVYYQKALIANAQGFENTSTDSYPEEFTSLISPLLYFSTLTKKAGSFLRLHQQSGDNSQLEKALYCYRLAGKTAQYIQKTYGSDEAKLFLIQRIYPVYEKAITVAHKLYKLHKDPVYARIAFEFSEISKAAVLTEMLDELNIKAKAKVSDSLIREERRWKQQITRARLKLTESRDSSEIAMLQEILTDGEIKLTRTLKSLQRDEKYYQLKYQQDTINLGLLQQEILSSEDALLEYFLGQDSLFSFLLTHDSFEMKSVALDSTFFSALRHIKSSLYDYDIGEDYREEQAAFRLYQVLLKPYEQEIKQKERIIIIPDGDLSYIPLEMLKDDPESSRYLLEDYTFSYAYSASLLKDAVSKRRAKEKGSVLAMAPFAGNEKGNIRSNGFKTLFSSKEEVEKIGGSIYLENRATKRLFLELAGSYGVIHLATHASISSNTPLESFIAFYPDQDSSSVGYRLYTQELYNMQLDSVKLVVLSACEAGNGKLVRGEGIISLARAFAYAGCPNMITTLWKAQDKSTAAIASGLHKYLKEGYAKDEALRKAKIDYLAASDVHPMMKSPYYWANFIFIGDPAPIHEPSRAYWWISIASMIILLVIVMLLIKQRGFKRKQS